MIIWRIYNLLIILRRIIRKSILDNTVETKDNLLISIFWVFSKVCPYVFSCFFFIYIKKKKKAGRKI